MMAVKNDKLELHFISSKPAVLNNDEQLLINLQECSDIMRPSQQPTWSDKLITPLRDRLVHHDVMCCYGDGYQDNDILVVQCQSS